MTFFLFSNHSSHQCFCPFHCCFIVSLGVFPFFSINRKSSFFFTRWAGQERLLAPVVSRLWGVAEITWLPLAHCALGSGVLVGKLWIIPSCLCFIRLLSVGSQSSHILQTFLYSLKLYSF